MPKVEFLFNGGEVCLEIPDDELLLDTLRDRLRVTSARYGCGIGVCGTCTVLVDGLVVSSCLQLTTMVAGRSVTTAESFLTAADTTGESVRDGFLRGRAYQCSYCIPGMALTAAALLKDRQKLTCEELREQLGGNLCRCGTYPQVAEVLALLRPEEDDA